MNGEDIFTAITFNIAIVMCIILTLVLIVMCIEEM